MQPMPPAGASETAQKGIGSSRLPQERREGAEVSQCLVLGGVPQEMTGRALINRFAGGQIISGGIRMKYVTICFWILAMTLGFSEKASAETDAMQAMQAQMEAKQREEQFKTPLKPEVAKDRAVSGNRSAPILLVTYSDFQCPFCRQGFTSVQEVLKKYGKKVAFMFKNFPLTNMHPYAMPAAIRFEAIALQSAKKAYQFHDEVFSHQERISEGEPFLDEVAKKLSVNMTKMKKDMDSDKVKERIAADTAEAQSYGMRGTPGFVVAGVALKGAYPTTAFEEIIDRRLAERKVLSKK
jgi:protein-disulfide isomerase